VVAGKWLSCKSFLQLSGGRAGTMTRVDGEPGPERVRLAELVCAVSLATDVGMGQPFEHALRTCLVATRLAAAADLAAPDRHATYYLGLLRHVGCTADAAAAAAFFGDELAARAGFATIDPGDRREMIGYLRAHVGAGAPPLQRAVMIAAGIAVGARGPRAAFAAHCEVAVRFATRLRLDEPVRDALDGAFERWDGRGFPRGLAAGAVPVAAQVVALARDVEVTHRLAGPQQCRAMVRGRSGGAYDPALAERFGREAGGVFELLDRCRPWEDALAAEPAPVRWVGHSDVDAVCAALGDFADLKSPHTLGRSRAVAGLATATAQAIGLSPAATTEVRRAALVADLGRVGVSNGVWDRAGPLDTLAWERVRLHPYLSERILAHAGPLAPLARLAGAHHERLDGSGYHRGAGAAQLDTPLRVLAAADVHRALVEARPYRAAHSPAEAAQALVREAGAGRLDGEVVSALLAVVEGTEAGDGPHVPRSRPGGLTDREVDVLRALARGHTNRAIGRRLGISPKTVSRHLEHVYAKLSVRTRAGAALWAAERGLLR
jgi:HD-GYP domain-containing protein (c-di-GMP phosphodiesterase class II)